MKNEIEPVQESSATHVDSMVCYCFNYTANRLREKYNLCGSLAKLEELTRVGSACTGCKALLHNMFNETPRDPYQLDEQSRKGSLCRKPGEKIMKGFVIATDDLDSRIVSSNAVAPQFSGCDATSSVTFALLDQSGAVVTNGTQKVGTNGMFNFTTETLNIPRPFVGMFIMHYDRSNLGASRFNIQWYGSDAGMSATHENTSTGRPKVTLPMIVDQSFLDGPNTIYLGLMNPHELEVPCRLIVRDIDRNTERAVPTFLGALSTHWIDANSSIFRPAVEASPSSRFTFRLESLAGMGHAIAIYFFIHNRETRLWTAQHL